MSDLTTETRGTPEAAESGGAGRRLTLTVAIAVVIVLILRMTLFTVQDHEAAVVLTFGKPTREQTTPGASAKAPWPIQRVRTVDKRLRVLKGPLEEVATEDGRAVVVGTFVLWRIASPQMFLEKLGDVGKATQRLETILHTHQAAAISSTPFEGLISVDRSKLRYRQVEAALKAALQGEAEGLGLEVEMVGIRRLGLPKTATESVFERMRKDRERLAGAILERGRRTADTIRHKAQAERNDRLTVAQVEARNILSKAEAKARPHIQRMAADPSLALHLKKVEALKKILAEQSTTLVFTPQNSPFDLLRRAWKRTEEKRK